MTRRQRHPTSGTTKTVTALAYAVLVAVVPVQHALQESVVGAQSIEASHSDECPTLHAGPACVVAALSLFAMPTVQARHGDMALSEDSALPTSVVGLDSSAILTTHRSRAPPSLK